MYFLSYKTQEKSYHVPCNVVNIEIKDVQVRSVIKFGEEGLKYLN